MASASVPLEPGTPSDVHGSAALTLREGAGWASLQRPVLDAATHTVFAYELVPVASASETLRSRARHAGDISQLATDFDMRREWLRAAMAGGLAEEGRALILPINAVLASEAPSELEYLLDRAAPCLTPATAHQVVIQIDEDRVLGDVRSKRALIDVFRSRGYRICISGFGAGFEGLKGLLHAGADLLRLSPTLTGRVHGDATQRSIVRGLLTMTEDLAVTLIADEVSHARQAEALCDLGLHLQQGSYHGAPLPLPQLPVDA